MTIARRAVVSDLDGTLVHGTSAERRFLPFLLRAGVLGPRQIVPALSRAMLTPWMGFNGAFRRNKLWYAGLSEATVHRYAEEFVDNVLVDFLAEPVLDVVAGLREQGHALILLTGAPSFLARAVARLLAFDEVVATELEVRDGRFTGHLAGPHYFGDAKVEGVHDLVRRHELDLAECVGLADHAADIPFLACFGRPIAVYPRPGLREHASSRGWEVIDGRSEPPATSASLRSEPTSPVRR